MCCPPVRRLRALTNSIHRLRSHIDLRNVHAMSAQCCVNVRAMSTTGFRPCCNVCAMCVQCSSLSCVRCYAIFIDCHAMYAQCRAMFWIQCAMSCNVLQCIISDKDFARLLAYSAIQSVINGTFLHPFLLRYRKRWILIFSFKAYFEEIF